MKFSSKDRNVHLELPVKIEFEGKVYWIKRATKTNGIYLNDVEPKNQPERKEDVPNKR